MKKNLGAFVGAIGLIAVLSAASSVRAQTRLSYGESITIGGETITCGGGGGGGHRRGHGSTATSKTCAQEDIYGRCMYFEELSISGPFCAEGTKCGKQDIYGRCIYFNTTAACGDNGCTNSKKCAQQDIYGRCVYFEQIVSCR